MAVELITGESIQGHVCLLKAAARTVGDPIQWTILQAEKPTVIKFKALS
jgi:hypothetical protein